MMEFRAHRLIGPRRNFGRFSVLFAEQVVVFEVHTSLFMVALACVGASLADNVRGQAGRRSLG